MSPLETVLHHADRAYDLVDRHARHGGVQRASSEREGGRRFGAKTEVRCCWRQRVWLQIM